MAKAEERERITKVLEEYDIQPNDLPQALTERDEDYIIALSRTAPRLLGLLREKGMAKFNCPIITEKTLQFMPEEELNNSSVVIFDDLVISGTSIWTLLDDLSEYENLDIKVVTIAVDKENVAPVAFNIEEQTINLGESNGQSEIAWNPLRPLEPADRFAFTKDVVHELSRYHKPYDIDFPIFSMGVDPEFMTRIASREETSDITMAVQTKADLRCYSFLPDPQLVNSFFQTVFNIDPYRTHLNKIRIYYDVATGAVTFAPMAIFEIHKDVFGQEQKIFDESLGWCNKIIADVKEQLHSTSKLTEDDYIALYRLTWYFTSYLFGLTWLDRLDKDQYQFDRLSPKQLVNHDDLLFLFDDNLSNTILDLAETNYEPTKRFLSSNISTDSHDKNEFGANVEITAPKEFSNDWYSKLEDGFKENTLSSLNTGFKLGSIPEHIYKEIEQPAREQIRDLTGENGGSPEDLRGLKKRLDTGFTFEELLGILTTHHHLDANDSEQLRQASIALDILIDKGILVSGFTMTEDGILQRAYRHGEAGEKNEMSEEEFEKLMTYVMKEIFDEISTESLHSVTIEKIAYLVWQNLVDNDVADLAEDKDCPFITSDFDIYGQVLNLGDDDYQFNYWATDIELLAERDGDYYFLGDNDVNNKSKLPDDDLSVSYTNMDRVQSTDLANLLWKMQKEIETPDETSIPHPSNFNYLVAITSCYDPEEYTEALKTELEYLLARSGSYSFSHATSKFDEVCEMISESSDDQVIKSPPECISENECEKILDQIDSKRDLWNNIEEIVGVIEDYLEDQTHISFRKKEPLQTHLDNIKRSHRKPPDGTDLARMFQMTLNFCSIVEQYGACFKEAKKMVDVINKRDRLPDIYWLRLNGNIREYNKEQKKKWPQLRTELEDSPELDELGELPQINIPYKPFSKQGGNPTESLMTILSQLQMISDQLSTIYGAYEVRMAKLDRRRKHRRGDRYIKETDYSVIANYEFYSETGERVAVPDISMEDDQELSLATSNEGFGKKVGKIVHFAENNGLYAQISACSILDLQNVGRVSRDTALDRETALDEIEQQKPGSITARINKDIPQTTNWDSHRIMVTRDISNSWDDSVEEQIDGEVNSSKVGENEIRYEGERVKYDTYRVEMNVKGEGSNE